MSITSVVRRSAPLPHPQGMKNRNGAVMTTPTIDAGRLWAGGVAAAAVGALVAVLGILVSESLVGVTIMAPGGQASTTAYALVSAVVALAATGLIHILLLTAPRAPRFFVWIMVLATLIAVVLPLGLVHGRDNALATAALNLVIGLVITALVAGVGRSVLRARRYSPEPGEPGRGPYT